MHGRVILIVLCYWNLHMTNHWVKCQNALHVPYFMIPNSWLESYKSFSFLFKLEIFLSLNRCVKCISLRNGIPNVKSKAWNGRTLFEVFQSYYWLSLQDRIYDHSVITWMHRLIVYPFSWDYTLRLEYCEHSMLHFYLIWWKG